MIFTNEDLEQIPFTSKKYANQKSMYIHKTDADKDHIYSLINQEAHMRALDDFGWSAAYNLWVYLCCNQDGYIEDFSPTHLGELVHKGRKTIQRAAKDLEDKGYLVRVGENDYIFFENPDDNGCVIDDTSFKRCVTHDTGLEGCVTDDTGLNLQENKGVSPVTQGVSSMTHCVSPMTQGCVTGVYSNIINSIDNIKDNIKFSPRDNQLKLDYHFGENSSYGDDMNKDVHPLSKDEIRPIYTRDGCKYDLSISCILDGLSNALSNRKNEDVLKEISEKCDLTDKQRSEIEDTIELWRLGF